MRTGIGVLYMTNITSTTTTKFTKWHSLVMQHAMAYHQLWKVLAP
jgi:hypothetical protein